MSPFLLSLLPLPFVRSRHSALQLHVRGRGKALYVYYIVPPLPPSPPKFSKVASRNASLSPPLKLRIMLMCWPNIDGAKDNREPYLLSPFSMVDYTLLLIIAEDDMQLHVTGSSISIIKMLDGLNNLKN